MNSLVEVAYVIGELFYYLFLIFILGAGAYLFVRLASAAFFKSKKDYEEK